MTGTEGDNMPKFVKNREQRVWVLNGLNRQPRRTDYVQAARTMRKRAVFETEHRGAPMTYWFFCDRASERAAADRYSERAEADRDAATLEGTSSE